jgi:hypothetical protein
MSLINRRPHLHEYTKYRVARRGRKASAKIQKNNKLVRKEKYIKSI